MIQFLFCVPGYEFDIAFNLTLNLNPFDLNIVGCVRARVCVVCAHFSLMSLGKLILQIYIDVNV